MSELLKKFLARPHAGKIIREFARHVERKVDPALFAGAYLELMRSQDDSLRQDATGVLVFAASRSWEEIRDVFLGKVNEDARDVLNTAEAKDFYNKWIAMVTKQISKYYNEFLDQEGGRTIT